VCWVDSPASGFALPRLWLRYAFADALADVVRRSVREVLFITKDLLASFSQLSTL
jgi:hypothetical protein